MASPSQTSPASVKIKKTHGGGEMKKNGELDRKDQCSHPNGLQEFGHKMSTYQVGESLVLSFEIQGVLIKLHLSYAR